MALDKEEQAYLYERCREALGDRGAKLLMTELPPTGWGDLATKKDLEMLEYKLTGTFERALREQTKTFVMWTTSLTGAVAGIFGTITILVTR